MATHSASQVLILPIPTSKETLARRGYNQAELLASVFAKFFMQDHESNESVYDTTILLKRNANKKQSLLGKRVDRFNNSKGSFFINPDSLSKVHGKTIILIDDVTTTGATLMAAKELLKSSGAFRVICFALAH
jgi:ComF family protein